MTYQVETSQIEPKLTQLINGLGAFLSLLENEAEILRKNDLAPLTDISQTKSKLSEQVEQDYLAIMAPFKQHQENETLSIAEVIELPIFESLASKLQIKFFKALELSQRCHEKNLSNGITIQTLNNLNQTLINLMSGTPENATTYGSEGKKMQKGSSKHTLGTA